MSDLTTRERTNLSAVAVRHGLVPVHEVTRVVTMEPEPTYTAWDFETQRQHTQELSTMGIGPAQNIRRKADRKWWKPSRDQLHTAMATVIILVAAAFGALLVIWAFASIVRTAIG